MISLWTFFWGVGGEVNRSQHHQPSGLTDLGSICFWAAYHSSLTSPTWRGFQHLQNSSEVLFWVFTDGEIGPCSSTVLDCFSLILHPLPSLINNCLNLPTGTHKRSWKLNEGKPSKKWGTQKGFVAKNPTGICSVSLITALLYPNTTEKSQPLSKPHQQRKS